MFALAASSTALARPTATGPLRATNSSRNSVALKVGPRASASADSDRVDGAAFGGAAVRMGAVLAMSAAVVGTDE
jgi:hypothetical protein